MRHKDKFARLASKKLILFLAAFLFLLSFRLARADIVINEIMYYPNNGDTDWAEFYNNGVSDVAIDTVGSSDSWRISTSSSPTPTKYNLNGPNFTIPAGGYVILACDSSTFLSLHPGFIGNVVDITSTGFSNMGGTLELWDNTGAVISSVSYGPSYGANEDGNSLQLISGVWSGALPTPGAANQADATAPVPTTATGSGGLVADYSPPDDSSSASDSTTTTKTATSTQTSKMKVVITAQNIAFVGAPLSLQAIAYGSEGEHLNFGKYFWNFGDGDSKEMEASTNQEFTHTYFYPGDYIVSVDYYSDNYSETPEMSGQLKLKVVPIDISISKVGDSKDFFVELTNNTNYDADISGYFLTSDTKSFTLPKNTILAANNKMMIPGRVTNFSLADESSLKLLNPDGDTVFDYGGSNSPLPESYATAEGGGGVSVHPVASVTPQEGNNSLSSAPKKVNLAVAEFPPINLSASALQADPLPASNSRAKIIFLLSAILVSAGAVGAYFIRRKKVASGTEDFEILDE